MEIAPHSRQGEYDEFDLYLNLNLDEEEVRSRKPKEQDRIITKAFRQHIHRHHPDRPTGNNANAQRITHAYNILKNRQTRATYHKLSQSRKNFTTRFKEIFFSRTCTNKEKWKRRILFAGSVLLLVGGFAICIGTGGLGLPIVLGCGAAAGACINAGMIGAKRILSIDMIEDEFSCKGFAKSLIISGAIGAIGGLATAGIGAALSEVLTLGLSEISLLEEIIANLPGDAINGGLFSIASDTIKSAVDNKSVTMRDFVLNACLGAFTNMMLSNQIRRFTGLVKDVLNIISKGHISISAECRSHFFSTIKFGRSVKYTAKMDRQGEEDPIIDSINSSPLARISPYRSNVFSTTEFSRSAKDTAVMNLGGKENPGTVSRGRRLGLSNESGVITYYSKGFYFTRMSVQYSLDGKPLPEPITEKGSGKSITIPAMATDIEVRFQVMRFIGIWINVKKWDRNRESQSWIKPTQPHIFRYSRPVRHIFTLDGTLYYEAVVKVTDAESCQLLWHME